MAHESFENEGVGRLLNEGFVSIKVDREERPDVDAVYMTATQAMTGQGGWPMTVVLDHDGNRVGSAAKSTVHHRDTPLHLAFSCYLFDDSGRVLLTRDRELVERAKKAGAIAILISPDKVTDQLCELIKHIPINTRPIMERCTVCNGRLRRATTEDLRRTPDQVPGHLVEEGKDFWICGSCSKIYWMGSHWRNILKTSSDINVCKK